MDALLLPGVLGQVLPDLIGRIGQDRRDELGQRHQDLIQRGLSRAPLAGRGPFTVQAVLERIEVEAAHVHRAEVVHLMEHHVVLVVAVRLDGAPGKAPKPQHRPAVDLRHGVKGHGVLDRVKVRDVAQEKPGRVADPPVDFGQLVEDIFRDAHIAPVVDGGRPQAQHVRPVLPHHRLGLHHVAQGLGHLAAFLVHHETVGEHGAVRRVAPRGHRRQQRRLEPAPVLVAALKIHVGRPPQFGPLGQHRRVGRTRVEPDVHDVLFFVKRGAAAVGACLAGGQDLTGFPLEPGVGTLPPEQVRHRGDGFLIDEMVAASLARKDGDGHAPNSLPRDAPVGPLRHHVGDALFAPGRDPPDATDGGQGRLAETFHRREPLLGRPEDDRVATAPAMGVLVIYVGALEQAPVPLQVRDDGPVGLGHLLAGVRPAFSGEPPAGVHGRKDRQPVAHAHLVVLEAVPRRRVHAAGPLFQRHMLGQDDRAFPVKERMPCDDAFQLPSTEAGPHPTHR